MTKKSRLLGVDLGGTKIEAALLDDKGAVIDRARCATPKHSYEETLSQIHQLCLELEARAGIVTPLPLGLCTPGSPSPESGLMRNCNSTALNGHPLREDFQKHANRAVRLANDADCFTLSEAKDGAGQAMSSVFGVILGTGVGGGIVIHGHLLRGPNAISGEWGHNAMPLARVNDLPDCLAKARPCYCGRSDCIETWLSGPGLALTHEQLHKEEIVLDQLSSQMLDSKHRTTLALYADMLSAALASIVNIIDPDVIVLGGGLSNIETIYTAVPELLSKQVFSDVCRTALRPAQHGDSSGVRGAAWLWQS